MTFSLVRLHISLFLIGLAGARSRPHRRHPPRPRPRRTVLAVIELIVAVAARCCRWFVGASRSASSLLAVVAAHRADHSRSVPRLAAPRRGCR